MSQRLVTTLDLHFQDRTGAIAAYLIPHRQGYLLIETGPGSTLAQLKKALLAAGCALNQITDVFLTHIHLDHAGAAGWLARQGMRIHVHPVGAPHMINPEKLLASATRIYGEKMDSLWGEFLPVPAEQLNILSDGQMIDVGGRQLLAIDTPGHAEHHFAYLCEDICFSGDICGVRVAGLQYLRLPMPPPELHLKKWRQSIDKLRAYDFSQLAPTHFGMYGDVDWHLDALDEALDDVEQWIESYLPSSPSLDELNSAFLEWTGQRAQKAGVDPTQLEIFEAANPSWMSSRGIERYWRKYC